MMPANLLCTLVLRVCACNHSVCQFMGRLLNSAYIILLLAVDGSYLRWEWAGEAWDGGSSFLAKKCYHHHCRLGGTISSQGIFSLPWLPPPSPTHPLPRERFFVGHQSFLSSSQSTLVDFSSWWRAYRPSLSIRESVGECVCVCVCVCSYLYLRSTSLELER